MKAERRPFDLGGAAHLVSQHPQASAREPILAQKGAHAFYTGLSHDR